MQREYLKHLWLRIRRKFILAVEASGINTSNPATHGTLATWHNYLLLLYYRCYVPRVKDGGGQFYPPWSAVRDKRRYVEITIIIRGSHFVCYCLS